MNEDQRTAAMLKICRKLHPELTADTDEDTKMRIYNECYEFVMKQGIYAVLGTIEMMESLKEGGA